MRQRHPAVLFLSFLLPANFSLNCHLTILMIHIRNDTHFLKPIMPEVSVMEEL